MERLSKKVKAGIFCVLGIFLMLTQVFVKTQAETIVSSVAIVNAPPSVISVSTSDEPFGSEDYSNGIINTLVAGGGKTIYVTGRMQDNSGGDDIQRASLVFYRSGVANGSQCAQNDANDCYVVQDCALDATGVSDLQRRYSCEVLLPYFADGTMPGGEFPDEHWIASVTGFDATERGSSDESLSREIETLLALSMPSSIDYASMEAGSSTTEETEAEIYFAQNGNDEADVEVSFGTWPGAPFYGGTMDCVHNGGEGSIPADRQQWSLAPNHYNGTGTTQLTASPTIAAINVGYRHGENPEKPLYWNISIPASGVSGTCSGSISISAVSH